MFIFCSIIFFRYCGPGTRLHERLKRGDPGINGLDRACKQHDIAYDQHKDVENRNKADRILAEAAWARYKAKDASFLEKSVALAVMGIMKAKSKFGMGLEIKKTRKTSSKRSGTRKKATKPVTKRGRKKKATKKSRKAKKALNFNDVVQQTTKGLEKSKSKDAKTALKIAKNVIRKSSKKVLLPRVIPLVQGGLLPLLPIIASLGALGSLVGGAAQVAKTVKEAANARQELQELKRHNAKVEAIAIGGRGLYLRPYSSGYGLFLKNPKN